MIQALIILTAPLQDFRIVRLEAKTKLGLLRKINKLPLTEKWTMRDLEEEMKPKELPNPILHPHPNCKSDIILLSEEES